MSTDLPPMTPEEAARRLAECPYHLVSEGHPTAMELAAKTGQDKTDAEIAVMAKGLTPNDFYWLFRRATLEGAKNHFFTRIYRLMQAQRK